MVSSIVLFSSLRTTQQNDLYLEQYNIRFSKLVQEFDFLKRYLEIGASTEKINQQIRSTRLALKRADMWLRYSNPIAYKFLNGPLPIEWEVEVFEKWEKPYKREAAGLTLLQIGIEEETSRDKWLGLITKAIDSLSAFQHPNVVDQVSQPQNMYFANRLHLLNLATIYSTGFECPNTDLAIHEIVETLKAGLEDYKLYNTQHPEYKTSSEYIFLYTKMIDYVESQPKKIEHFDHFTFIKDFVNPLFRLNQLRIIELRLNSNNVNDYSLSNDVLSIFDKNLYKGLERKGVYKGLKFKEDLSQLYVLGEQLFSDPILSVNNKRSCASCHKPSQLFNDTIATTSLQLDKINRLTRNTPSLVGSLKNHLLMLDGRHISPSGQADEVTQNPLEMGLGKEEVLSKVLSVKTYKKGLKRLANKTINKNLTNDHIYSALIFYYSSLDTASSKLDNAMNNKTSLDENAIKGFNLFMSKAECATCHFAPQYNGVKPPYVSSEFEVIGTPNDTTFSSLSSDKGRGSIHRVPEMHNAFRTPTLRNLSLTQPYMHNGVFETLDEVIDFYNLGGGQGKGLEVTNQTLNGNKLNLSLNEIESIKAFLLALNEDIQFPNSKMSLPKGKGSLKNRKTIY